MRWEEDEENTKKKKTKCYGKVAIIFYKKPKKKPI